MTALSPDLLRAIDAKLGPANAEITRRYPPLSGRRQPVHTVYGGAHLFQSDLAKKLGRVAVRNLDTYGGDPAELAESIGLISRGAAAHTVMERVRAKLEREAVEDFRIDFEDGYGNRSDAEEDGHARQAAEETAKGHASGTLPPFIGIRIKTLSQELYRRSLRTLDLYLATLVGATGGTLPEGFVVTLPKITTVEHVEVLCETLDAIEAKLGLAPGSIEIELMIETTQSIVDASGVCPMPAWAQAARGRCRGAHFGTYDYTAACGITAAYQRMRHPACDHARSTMKVAFAGTEVMLSDGATAIMPVPLHRAEEGQALTDDQVRANLASVHSAWRLHVADTRHSLECGIYQGWDLHPAQLVTRYAAVFDFFLDGLAAASERLTNFVAKAAQATLVGDTFDDAATGQGLLNFFLLGIGCGAFPEEEAIKTGLTLDELRSRSFVQILRNRRS